MKNLLTLIEQNDFCRHCGMTFMKSLRSFVNTWHLYRPINKTEKLPYSLRGNYYFVNRGHTSKSLLIILAGYKQPLWDNVFNRIKKYIPNFVDVCVATSGRRIKILEDMCAKNNWSYLSTQRNHVCLIQNLAIHLHPAAQWIYKIDEDIFITKGFFEKLKDVYEKAQQENRYDIGFVAPLINVNGYGYVRIIEKLGLESLWNSKFEELQYTDGLHHHTGILSNPDCAKFMWGDGAIELSDIDVLNKKFEKEGFSYRFCPIRFSIGAILFSRASWEDWNMFPVVMGTGMGEDEMHLCQYCLFHSKVIVVAENIVVGHLGFGPQTNEMMRYYASSSIGKMRICDSDF